MKAKEPKWVDVNGIQVDMPYYVETARSVFYFPFFDQLFFKKLKSNYFIFPFLINFFLKSY